MKNFLKHYRWELTIFFLSLILRIPQLFRMDFAGFPEFYRDYYMVEKIMSGHLPLLGPPSMQTNFYFGPIYYYLYTPLFFVSHFHPASLILTGILFYSASAVVLYKLLLLWLKDEKVARFGAIFYAISIYGIALTSYVSNPNFLPFWVIVFYYYLSKIILDEQKTQNFILLGLAFGIAAQLHTTATIVLLLSSAVPVVYYILPKLYRSKQILKAFFSFLLAATIPALPYIYFEFTSKFSNLRNLFSFGSNHLQLERHSFALEKISDFFQSSLNPFYMSNAYSYIQPTALYLLLALAGLIILVALIISLKKNSQTIKETPIILPAYAYLIVAGWLIAASSSLIFFNKSPHSHYLIIFWPLPIIFLAAICFWIKTRLMIFKSIVFFFCLMSALQIYTFYNHPATSWLNFNSIYQTNYKNNPNTPEIGSETVGWPQQNQH